MKNTDYYFVNYAREDLQYGPFSKVNLDQFLQIDIHERMDETDWDWSDIEIYKANKIEFEVKTTVKLKQ